LEADVSQLRPAEGEGNLGKKKPMGGGEEKEEEQLAIATYFPFPGSPQRKEEGGLGGENERKGGGRGKRGAHHRFPLYLRQI